MERLTRPPRLSFADPASFAALTLRERLPKIVDLTFAAVRGEPRLEERIAALRRSLPDGMPPQSLGVGEAERAFWNEFMRAYSGARWVDLPFFEGEFILYRAILDAVEHGAGRELDPFGPVKSEALEKAVQVLPRAARSAAELDGWSLPALRRATEWALIGNTADLSHWFGPQSSPRSPWIDDLGNFFHDLSPDASGNIELVLDNAGEELIGDLVLVDYLLKALPSVTVRVHAKTAPIFVSDVTLSDWSSTLARVCDHTSPEVSAWGRRLREHQRTGRLQVSTNVFWIRPCCFFEMTGPLRDQFAGAIATIIKGDLNYRRYVQDRAWPLDSPTARHRVTELAPVLALRVLKSELAVGLPAHTVAHLREHEPDGLYSGKNSVVQYFR